MILLHALYNKRAGRAIERANLVMVRADWYNDTPKVSEQRATNPRQTRIPHQKTNIPTGTTQSTVI